MVKVGQHIDRAMYKELKEAAKAPEAEREDAIEQVLEKHMEDGPMAARDKLVVGEHNALEKFLDKDLPQGELRDKLKMILSMIPTYNVAAVRLGQPVEIPQVDPMQRDFYVGTWKIAPGDLPDDDRIILRELTVNADGSWKGTDGLGNALQGENFGVAQSPIPDEGDEVKRAMLELQGPEGQTSHSIMAASQGQMAVLMTAIDPVGGEHQMLMKV